jgi:hypothetical protein
VLWACGTSALLRSSAGSLRKGEANSSACMGGGLPPPPSRAATVAASNSCCFFSFFSFFFSMCFCNFETSHSAMKGRLLDEVDAARSAAAAAAAAVALLHDAPVRVR